MHTAYIALGSNLGDRRKNLDQALELLAQHSELRVARVSGFFETTPVGGPAGQGPYLNAAAEVNTDLSPRELLDVLLEVERSLGRVRGEVNAPRTIDLDLLLYDDLVLAEPNLTVPHPRLAERWFVLAPLAEIAPRAVHPLARRTIAELLRDLEKGAFSGAAPGKELTGLRAVVTGSTRGIGKAMALELASAGAEVIVHGRNEQAARAVADQVRAQGSAPQVLLADLSSPDECHRLVQAAWQLRPVRIWINNAGTDTLTTEATRWPFLDKLRALWEVDVTATIALSREVGKRMKEHGGGVILNMGWDQADTGMEGDSGQLFAAVKGAVMAFSKSLAVDLAPEVRVNCLAPGWIRTAWGEAASAAWQDRVKRETLVQRWGTPEDVARAARWLVSPAAAFITGQVIRVNGGAVR
jgi:2-amino-4-hydroxy-6-hydroxymethyldihydropteridine diphosphokinase